MHKTGRTTSAVVVSVARRRRGSASSSSSSSLLATYGPGPDDRKYHSCRTRILFRVHLDRMYATVADALPEDIEARKNAQRMQRDGDGSTRERPTEPQMYPYPQHPNPTPHQIFHLPHGASQAQIKARYFELVRSHHPDTPHSKSLPPNVAHTRFRQIKASYDFLRGHTLSPHPNARPAPQPRNFDPYLHELARRRRAWEASSGRSDKRAHSNPFDAAGGRGNEEFAGFSSAWTRGGFDGFGAHKDERSDWNPSGRNERIILGAGVVTLLAGLFPTLPGVLYEAFFPGIVPTVHVVDPDAPSESKGTVGKSTAATTPGSGAPISSSSSSSAPSSTPPPDLGLDQPTPTSTSATTPLSQSTNTNTPTPAFDESELSKTTRYWVFTAGPDRTHRNAVAALKQARYERTEMGLGVERREGVKKRVKEIKEAQQQQQQQVEVGGGAGDAEKTSGNEGDSMEENSRS